MPGPQILTPEQIETLNALVRGAAATSEPQGMEFLVEEEASPGGMDFTEEVATAPGPLPLQDPWEGEAPQEQAPLPGREAAPLEGMDVAPQLNGGERIQAQRAAMGMPQQSGQMSPAQIAGAQQAGQQAAQAPTQNTHPLPPGDQTASVAEHHARPAAVAAGPEEAPGATTTEERARLDRAVEQPPNPADARAKPAGGQEDIFRRLQEADSAAPSDELRTAQRRQGILRGLQALMGTVGAGLSMADDAELSKLGAGLATGGAMMPAGAPMANYEAREAERARARGAIGEEAALATTMQNTENQRQYGLNAQAELEMAREAQQAGLDAVQFERAESGPKSVAAESLRRSIQEIVEARAAEPERFPGEPPPPNLEGLNAAQLDDIYQEMLGRRPANVPRRRGGGGGGGGTRSRRGVPDAGSPLTAREQGLVDESAALGSEQRAAAEQRIRDARGMKDANQYDAALQDMEAAQENVRTRMEPLRREMVALDLNQEILDRAARSVGALSDDQVEWLQRSSANQRAAQGGGYVAEGGRWLMQQAVDLGLDESEMAAAEDARRDFDRVVDMFARAESGAAINSAEWVRFYSRAGGDIVQSPRSMREGIRELQQEHSRRLGRWRESSPVRGSSRMTGDRGNSEPAEGQITVRFTGSDGRRSRPFVRGSREYRGAMQQLAGSGATWEDSNGATGEL